MRRVFDAATVTEDNQKAKPVVSKLGKELRRIREKVGSYPKSVIALESLSIQCVAGWARAERRWFVILAPAGGPVESERAPRLQWGALDMESPQADVREADSRDS